RVDEELTGRGCGGRAARGQGVEPETVSHVVYTEVVPNRIIVGEHPPTVPTNPVVDLLPRPGPGLLSDYHTADSYVPRAFEDDGVTRGRIRRGRQPAEVIGRVSRGCRLVLGRPRSGQDDHVGTGERLLSGRESRRRRSRRCGGGW